MRRCVIAFLLLLMIDLGSTLPALSDSRMGVSRVRSPRRHGLVPRRVGRGVSPRRTFLVASAFYDRFTFGSSRTRSRIQDPSAADLPRWNAYKEVGEIKRRLTQSSEPVRRRLDGQGRRREAASELGSERINRLYIFTRQRWCLCQAPKLGGGGCHNRKTFLDLRVRTRAATASTLRVCWIGGAHPPRVRVARPRDHELFLSDSTTNRREWSGILVVAGVSPAKIQELQPARLPLQMPISHSIKLPLSWPKKRPARL